jgi:hypothetical protein
MEYRKSQTMKLEQGMIERRRYSRGLEAGTVCIE